MRYNNLTWVFQSNNINEKDRSSLKQAAIHLGCETKEMGIIPFSHEAIGPLPDIEGTCVVYGSGGLLKLANRNGWKPGGWDGDKFDTSEVLSKFGSLALNGGGQEVLLSEIANQAAANNWKRVFVRPVAESKEFPGTVYSLHDLQQWMDRLQAANYFADQNNLMLIAPFKTLGREWRAFVVDQSVVTISQYASAGILDTSPNVPDIAVEFILKAIDIYIPAPCFVIDVAEQYIDGKAHLRVVEFNSINSSGLYDCEASKIVDAVSDYVLA